MKKIFNFYLFIMVVIFSLSSCSSGMSPSDNDNQMLGNNSSIDSSLNNDIMCGEYDDNLHYEYWQNLQTNPYGAFFEYSNLHPFKSLNRIRLTFDKGAKILVSLYNKDQTKIIYQAVPNKKGECYLFADFNQTVYDVKLEYLNIENVRITKNITVKSDDYISLNDIKKLNSNKIDLMFVLDATGSMNKELSYVKKNINEIITNIKEDLNDALINLSIILYKDESEDYVTKTLNFTKDLNDVDNFLKNEIAHGGKNFLEAHEKAFNKALEMNWESDSLKLLFHLSDSTTNDLNLNNLNESLFEMSKRGIRVISISKPIISKRTEYIYRSQSILTGGRYIFLVDNNDSSYIDASLEKIPNLENLHECIKRLVIEYYQGN